MRKGSKGNRPLQTVSPKGGETYKKNPYSCSCAPDPNRTPRLVLSASIVDVVVRKRKLQLFFLINDSTRLGNLVRFLYPWVSGAIRSRTRDCSLFPPKGLSYRQWPGIRKERFRVPPFPLKDQPRAHLQPGGPYQNGFSESFNARLNEACLLTMDMNLFPFKDIQKQ